MWNLIFFLIKSFLILTLPFILLVRGAIFFHVEKNWIPYACILGGVAFATLVVLVYLVFIYSKVSKRWNSGNKIKRLSIAAFMLVAAYSIHALFFLNTRHFKSPELKLEMNSLHPVVRLAASTLAYISNDLIITDASRVPEAYKKMGLKSKKRSLHYTQKDGYAYAIDIRTNGRPAWINITTQLYFRLMGFKTLRHVGTDDHLHVSLHCHFAPYAL